MPRSLLLCYAHPDDESFSCGGVMTRTADEGGIVTLVCATRGEVGEISDPALATPETLGTAREQELRDACREMGVHELLFLDYRDSGMMGTPENERPDAFWNQDLDTVTARLVEVIRRVRPQVMVTFDPGGGYGHPDHMKIHQASMAAFGHAGDASWHPELGPAHQPDRLFWSAIPRSAFRRLRDAMAAAGKDVTGIPAREDIGTPDDEVSTWVDVSPQAERKARAILSHRTQMPQDSFPSVLGEAHLGRVLSPEAFILALPEGATPPEGDLFAGLPTT